MGLNSNVSDLGALNNNSMSELEITVFLMGILLMPVFFRSCPKVICLGVLIPSSHQNSASTYSKTSNSEV